MHTMHSNSPIQWTHWYWTVIVFNVVIFSLLPLLFMLIHIKLRNIPKIELYGAYTSIIYYSQIIFYLTHYSSAVHIGISYVINIIVVDFGWFLAFIVPVNFFVTAPGILAQLFCCWYIMIPETDKKDKSSIEYVRKLLEDLKETGPTLVRGKMTQQGTGRKYKVSDIEQFLYKTWKNVSISGVEEMEKLLETDKNALKIKVEVEIKPEVGDTEAEYLDWCWEFPILEEIITTPEKLEDSHYPSKQIPSIQLPYLASNCNTRPLLEKPLPTNILTPEVPRLNRRYKLVTLYKLF